MVLKNKLIMKLVSESIHKYLKPKPLEKVKKEINSLSQERKDQELITQSKKGNKEIVEMLLKVGVDPNIQNKWDNTALILASMHGHKEIVELLKYYGVKNKYIK